MYKCLLQHKHHIHNKMSKWVDLPHLAPLASHDKVFIHWIFLHYLLGALGLCAASNALSPGAIFAGVNVILVLLK